MLEGFVSTFPVACQSIFIRHSQLETKPPQRIPETHNKHRGKMEAVRKVQPQDLLSGCHNICDCVVEALQRKEQRTIQSCELQTR